MKKLLKVLLWLAVIIAALLLAGLLTAGWWLGPFVAGALNAAVPELTATAFKVDSIAIKPFSGTFALRELHLANPSGYACREALGVGTVNVEIAVAPLLGGNLHFRNVEVAGVFASYVNDDAGSNNVARILSNVRSKGAGGEGSDAQTPPAEAEGAAAERYVKIDRLHVSGVRLQIAHMPVPIALPPVTLKNLGGEKGADWAAIGAEIGRAWSGSLKFGSDAFGVLSGMTGDVSAKTGRSLSKGAAAASEALKKVGVSADALGKGSDSVKEGAKKLGGLLGL